MPRRSGWRLDSATPHPTPPASSSRPLRGVHSFGHCCTLAPLQTRNPFPPVDPLLLSPMQQPHAMHPTCTLCRRSTLSGAWLPGKGARYNSTLSTFNLRSCRTCCPHTSSAPPPSSPTCLTLSLPPMLHRCHQRKYFPIDTTLRSTRSPAPCKRDCCTVLVCVISEARVDARSVER